MREKTLRTEKEQTLRNRLFTVLVATLALASIGGAFAADWHLTANLPLVTAILDELPTAGIGGPLHDMQEGVHAAVTKLTGVGVPHDYLWLHVGKTSIPVDPITFSK